MTDVLFGNSEKAYVNMVKKKKKQHSMELFSIMTLSPFDYLVEDGLAWIILLKICLMKNVVDIHPNG